MGERFAEGEQTRYAAAMLRVVLAIKREPETDLEEVITRVIGETGVDSARFRGFLTNHTEVMSRVAGRKKG